MKTPTPGLSKSTRSYYWKSFAARRMWRFAGTFVLLAAAVSLALTALTFAQKPEKEKTLRAEVRSENKAEPASRIEVPRKAVPSGKGANTKRLRGGVQDQDLVTRSQDEKGGRDRRDGKPREMRMRRGRPFTGDLRQLPQERPIKVEIPEREGPEPAPGLLVPPGESQESVSKEAAVPSVPQGANAPAPPPSSNFEGLDFATWGNGHPPDTVGDVGRNYYIQTINTSVGIFDKSNGNLISAFIFNTLMSQG